MKALILAAAALAAVIGSARAENGIASHYSTREQGIRTASGRSLHDGALTAAHKRLPFGSRVRVTNHARTLSGGKICRQETRRRNNGRPGSIGVHFEASRGNCS